MVVIGIFVVVGSYALPASAVVVADGRIVGDSASPFCHMRHRAGSGCVGFSMTLLLMLRDCWEGDEGENKFCR